MDNVNSEPVEQSPPVSQFRSAVEAFDAASRKLDNVLCETPRVTFPTRCRLGASRQAVVAFCRIFIQVHCEAETAKRNATTMVALGMSMLIGTPEEFPRSIEELRAWSPKEPQRLKDFEVATGTSMFAAMGETSDAMTSPLASLSACYQSLFFLLRAFQDRAYCVLLEVRTGQRAGKSTMTKAISDDGSIRKNNPVGAFLDNACSGYAAWFATFKNMRDDLKAAPPLSTPGPDLGINIHTIDEKNNSIGPVQRTFRLADATEGLQWSTRILDATIQLAVGR